MRDPSGYNQLIKGVRGNVAGTLAGSGSSKVPTLHSQEESLATLSTMSAMLEAFIPKKKKKKPTDVCSLEFQPVSWPEKVRGDKAKNQCPTR
jgi:hypothetical protein